MVSDRSQVPLTLDDERRRYYRLTAEGSRVLQAEVQRYARVVTVAQGRDLLAPA